MLTVEVCLTCFGDGIINGDQECPDCEGIGYVTEDTDQYGDLIVNYEEEATK